MKNLSTTKSGFYAMALEPFEIRSERIIMLAEAYAIFGALFLGGTWVIYEWGSEGGYGGSDNVVVNRVFEAVMALAISSNIYLAMTGSFVWVTSIGYGRSSIYWVYEAISILTYLNFVLIFMLHTVLLGLGLGIYAKLSPNWIETRLALSITFVFFVATEWQLALFMLRQIPLEIVSGIGVARPRTMNDISILMFL
jgi:hypothetical protein